MIRRRLAFYIAVATGCASLALLMVSIVAMHDSPPGSGKWTVPVAFLCIVVLLVSARVAGEESGPK